MLNNYLNKYIHCLQPGLKIIRKIWVTEMGRKKENVREHVVKRKGIKNSYNKKRECMI